MKLLLCSEGFYTPNTVRTCVELCGKPQNQISVAVINEAHAVVTGDKRWVLDDLNNIAKNFPAEMDIVNLLALSAKEVEERLAHKDVIFVVGGNPDYLMHVFEKTGFAKSLPRLLKDKVYVGSSAGSMVVGRRVSTKAYRATYSGENNFGINEYMALVDLAIKPHMDAPDLPNNRLTVLKKATKGVDFPVYGLQDDAAIVIDGGKQSFVGSGPYKVGQVGV